jgi:hypothetical protein
MLSIFIALINYAKKFFISQNASNVKEPRSRKHTLKKEKVLNAYMKIANSFTYRTIAQCFIALISTQSKRIKCYQIFHKGF